MAHMNGAPSVSIIVPARNEAGTIQRIVDELPTLGSRTEIIFVEGHSHDGTWEVIEKVGRDYRGPHTVRYSKREGERKVDAVRKGFELAHGDICIIYDADMSVPPDELYPFYELLQSGQAQFVNGSRFLYPMEKKAMRPLNYAGNAFFSFVFRRFTKQRITDTLCGTKALRRDDYRRIESQRHSDADPFGDFDLLYGAAQLGLSIREVPVHYRARVYGTTNISRWRHGFLLLILTAQIIGRSILRKQVVPLKQHTPMI